MKKSILFAAIAAATLILASCEKSEPEKKKTTVETSEEIVGISFPDSKNNLIEISPEAQALDVTVQTNVPCITYSVAENESSGHGFQFDHKNPDERKMAGNLNFVFHSGGNDEYTVDCLFYMIQSIWENDYSGFVSKWIDYTKYGLVEKDMNFRIRGKKGDRIIDFDDKDTTWSAGKHYLFVGKVTAMSEISEETLNFETIGLYEPFFDEIGHIPSSSYVSESCILTVENVSETINVRVRGKQRDNELPELLAGIKIGDTIEFPARAKNIKALKKREIEPVKVSSVLKVTMN